MSQSKYLFAVLLMLLLPGMAWSMDVAGVTFESELTMEEGGQTLQLNGAGIRKKFFLSIYAAALYLPEKSSDAQRIVSQDSASRIIMHMVYAKVEKEKVIDGWNEGFAANHDQRQLAPLLTKLQRFNGLFGDLKEDDRIYFDYIPGEGTRVTFNDELKDVIPGVDFKRALLRVWLGDSPVTRSLKSDLLGDH
jgi:hypothetical protein